MPAVLRLILPMLALVFGACSNDTAADTAKKETPKQAAHATEGTPAATARPGSPSGPYSLDSSHAYLVIEYSHLGASRPRVAFRDFDVELNFDATAIENSTVRVTVPVVGIDTGSDKFDADMQGEKWFDAANHPQIEFVSTSYTPTGEDTGRLAGDLTIKGKPLPVTLDVKINRAGLHPMKNSPHLGFSASGQILRSAWGMGAFVPAVSDEVNLVIEAEFEQPRG